ncbi:hypothetical protein ACWEQC_10530 [Streptomyces shenzhenensis]
MSARPSKHGKLTARLRSEAITPNSIQAGAGTASIVRRARRPWPVLTAEAAGITVRGSFSSRL